MSASNASLLPGSPSTPPVSPPKHPHPPTPTALALCLGLVKVRACPSACAPCPHSYQQGHQCLEKEDWELAVLFFSRALHLDSQLVRGRVWVGPDSLWHTLPPHCCTCQAHPLRATKSLLVTASSLRVDCGEATAAWDPSPQVDFYALRAEAYIQLCDFSSAVQNLRRAYSFQPENTKYLERLTFVLYLQVPRAAPGPHPTLGPTGSPSNSGDFPCSWD